MPRLTALLPPTPRLVADTWPIPARAIQSLVGEMPNPEDYEMTGTLVGVRKAEAGPALTAVIGISGQMNLPTYGVSSLNAQIHFVFNPVAAVPPAAGPGGGAPPATARRAKALAAPRRESSMLGATFPSVLMAWKATNLLPGDEPDSSRHAPTSYNWNGGLSRPPTPGAGTKNGLDGPHSHPHRHRNEFLAALPGSAGAVLLAPPPESEVEPANDRPQRPLSSSNRTTEPARMFLFSPWLPARPIRRPTENSVMPTNFSARSTPTGPK